MDEITPCFTSAKGYPTTHFDMDSVEAIGLVKMDILAQGGLAVLRDVKQSLAQSSAGVPPASLPGAPPGNLRGTGGETPPELAGGTPALHPVIPHAAAI